MDKSLKNTSKENKESREEREEIREEIKETGTLCLENDKHHHKIQMIAIIGEIEGHEALSGNTKSTKYEHIIPKLAQVEDDEETEGVLILLNTLGGDVEAGLAIAEMIASLSKPSVSLVLGGSHSIGGPLAVSADYSGPFQWNVYRGLSKLSKYGTYTRPYNQLYFKTFKYKSGKTGRTNA